jgi:hypothetical protein
MLLSSFFGRLCDRKRKMKKNAKLRLSREKIRRAKGKKKPALLPGRARNW